MSPAQFMKLKVGDRVRLLCRSAEYSCGHNTSDGKVYFPAGTEGVLGAVRVPAVHTEGSYFVCVDVAPPWRFEDSQGKPVRRKGKMLSPTLRCAAFAEDIKKVKEVP